MKKLFDSVEFGRAESTIPHNYQGQPSFTSVYFSADEDEGINASLRQQFCTCEKSMELNILSRTEVGSNLFLGDSEDESDAKIFCVPDSETGQQSAPNIQLELMPRQPQQA